MSKLFHKAGDLPVQSVPDGLFSDNCDSVILVKTSEGIVLYRITPCVAEYSEYKELIDILSLRIPEAWRPDGGVVAKFRDESGETQFIVPQPGETARDAIIRVMKLN
jgi:hypothetical protein